jgi:sulfur relay (sulfurtransferase) DsrC/TusE family protein
MIVYLQYITWYINRYINRVYKAIINKPIVEVLYKQEKVYIPFNKEQIEYLEKLFPLPVYKQGDTLLDIAYKTGKHEVVQFIKDWSAKGGKS